jgi:hypothetical protein
MSEKRKRASRRWRTAAVLAVGIAIGTVMVATPAGSHVAGWKHNWNRHIKPRADARYYTKAAAEARYYNVGETAANADRLDGADSSAFMQSRLDHNFANFTNTAGTQNFGQAACDPGFSVVGGGVFSDGAFGEQAVNSSYPSSTGAWGAWVDNYSAADLGFTVYVICAPANQVTTMPRPVGRKR